MCGHTHPYDHTCVDTPTHMIIRTYVWTHLPMWSSQFSAVMQSTKCTMSTQYMKYAHYIHAPTYIRTYICIYTFACADNYYNLVYFVLLCTHCKATPKSVVCILYGRYQLYKLYDEHTHCSLYTCSLAVRTYLYRSNWSGCCRSCERGCVQ